jgi:hypothetical protein
MSTTPLPLWTREVSARRSAWYLGLTTFSILVLELAAIRWIGSQIRVFAYFANLVLMAVFLGMGLGVALGRRYPHLFEWVFPALLVLAAVLALSKQVGLMDLGFPDPSISLWGADVRMVSFGQFCLATLVVVGLFWLVALVFLLMAIPVGWWFGQLPPLRAYTYDLLGSLLGVLAFTAVAALHLPPAVWFGLGLLPLAWVSRRWWAILGIGVILLTGWASQGAYFSPTTALIFPPVIFLLSRGSHPTQLHARNTCSVSTGTFTSIYLIFPLPQSARNRPARFGGRFRESTKFLSVLRRGATARWLSGPAQATMPPRPCEPDLPMFPVSKLIR